MLSLLTYAVRTPLGFTKDMYCLTVEDALGGWSHEPTEATSLVHLDVQIAETKECS